MVGIHIYVKKSYKTYTYKEYIIGKSKSTGSCFLLKNMKRFILFYVTFLEHLVLPVVVGKTGIYVIYVKTYP